MSNIDNIIFCILLMLLCSAVFATSDNMGMFSVLFSFLVMIKIFLNKGIKNLNLEKFEKALIVYFLFVTVSLLGSSLFNLSLHGYIKTFIYITFYFCAAIFFKDNENKIFPTMFFVAGLMTYESIIAILQNMGGVVEISGWQDMTNINPEQVVSRAYGTLKPYNPNLLAGYLLLGLSSFIYLILTYLNAKKRRIALFFAVLFLISLVAIIDTGCRGAYLGFLLFFPVLAIFLIYYIYKQFGGLSNIKKRYKNIFAAGIVGIILFIITNPALVKRFESIFALRADSSISFRLNVYESAWKMFLDNPFLGIGVGNQNFREIYGLYMKTGFDALGSYCVPLEIAVESGIFALISFVAFIFYVFKKCLHNIALENITLNKKILCLTVALMLCAFIGHGLFDTIWFRPQLQFLFWTFIAMIKD